MFLVLALSVSVSISKAHHGGEGISGVGVAGPIITIPAYTLPRGLTFLDIRSDYTNFDTFSNSKLIELNKQHEHVHNTSNLYIPSIALGHGFTDDLTFGLRLPYVFRYGIKDVHAGNIDKEGGSIGVGDITFFGQYRFLKNEKYHLNAALLTGIKIPSGVQRVKTRGGFLFEQDEQPGSGSWDPLVGLSLSKTIGQFSIDTNGLYKFATKGAQGSNLGDLVSYNLAVSHKIFNKGRFSFNWNKNFPRAKKLSFDLILEANGTWTEKPNTFHGFIDQSHGGTLIYLSPGFRLTYDKKWVWALSIGLPTIEDLNGKQKAPNIRLITSITKVF